MREYRIAPIKELALGIYDGPHATPQEADEGPIFLGIKNVTPEGRLDFSEIRHVSEQEYPKWTRRVTPQKDDVVFSYEATLHRYALIPEGFRGCLGRRMALVRPDKSKVLPRFLHYYFMSQAWKSIIESNIISGATVDRIPIKKFPDFKVSIPSINKQHSISEVLSAYDDLIENNRRRIQLLEESARLLYKEWFVHLRFPGHEHTKITAGIPEGWKRKKIAEVCDTIGGGTPSTKISDYWGGDITWVVPSDITSNHSLILLESDRKITEKGLRESSATMVPAETILMTSRASVGFFALMDHEVCTNQGFISIIPHNSHSRMYLLFNLLNRVNEIRGNAKGTTYPEISKGRFREMSILMPSQVLMGQFESIVHDIIQQVRCLMKSKMNLVKARDLLLPKLMTGEVAV